MTRLRRLVLFSVLSFACRGGGLADVARGAALHHFVEAAGMVAGLRFAGSALVRRTIFVTSGKWSAAQARPA